MYRRAVQDREAGGGARKKERLGRKLAVLSVTDGMSRVRRRGDRKR